MKDRITYFDFLRGLAILMVMGIHSYSMVPFDSIANALRINMRELLNFAVPLFLAISGFLLAKRKLRVRESTLYLLISKFLEFIYLCSFGLRQWLYCRSSVVKCG
jgi:peptidoglycan/LPS O-acetylase OafA/YrhL